MAVKKQTTKTPPSPVSKARTRKLAVAKGTIEGKTAKQIADEIGVTRDRVEQIKADPETQMLLQDLLAPHREQIEQAVKRTLETIVEDLDAPLLSMFGFVIKDDEGKPYPDRTVRSKARNDLINLLSKAQPKRTENHTTTLTLNQLVMIAQQYRAK